MDNDNFSSESNGEPIAGYQAPPAGTGPNAGSGNGAASSDPNFVPNPYQAQRNMGTPQYDRPQPAQYPQPTYTAEPQPTVVPVTPPAPMAGGDAGKKPDEGFKKRLMVAGGGLVLLLIIVVVAVVLMSSKTTTPPTPPPTTKTTQFTGGPNPATQTSLQDSDSAISHYIGALNNINDFPPDALSNDKLNLN